MTHSIILSEGWSQMAEAIDTEINAARKKFPTGDLLHAAMVEELGEATKALLDQHHGGKAIASRDVYYELIQTAAMVVRLAQEGDPQFPKYNAPPGISRENFERYGQD